MIWGNSPDAIPDSYRRYLENTMRKVFGFQGTPLKIHLRKKRKTMGGSPKVSIRVLDDKTINKIAAGEVERPAAAIRELIQNSIDAQATQIFVELESGGKKVIRVRDNGIGMSPEDAKLSLQRHATSKIRSDKDLFSISSLGFRGEAVPSIASVSRFEMITRTKGCRPCHQDFGRRWKSCVHQSFCRCCGNANYGSELVL